MIIVVPYVHGMLDQRTEKAVLEASQRHWFVDIDSGDHGAYGRLLRRLWQAQESFLVVEHDVIPWPEHFQGMFECEHRWCCAPYLDGPYDGFPHLGFTKFTAALMADHPLALERALLDDRYHRDEVHWRNVGDAIIRDLAVRGEQVCALHPAVSHAHSVV